MKKFTFAVLLTALLAISCCPCRKIDNSASRDLNATSWQLSQLYSRSITPAENQYTLSLGDDGKVSGMASCNRITGSYTFTSDSRILKFDHMGMTRMMCPPGDDHEDEFGQMLGKVTHFEVDGDMLIMLSGGESVALFKRLLK
ncbi:MAG: META domain-containing protein [Rikenellaceae bacterium]